MYDDSHPTDPLSAKEIRAAAALTRAHFSASENIRFNTISLVEPPLDEPTSERPDRIASVLLIEPAKAVAHRLLISLLTSSVISAEQLPPTTQPPFTPDDCNLAEQIVKADAQVRFHLKERYSITDVQQKLVCDPWSVHLADEYAPMSWRQDGKGARLIQTFLYRRDSEGDNHYAHPVDILPVVDLNAERVVAIEGLSREAPAIPEAAVNYRADLLHTNDFLATSIREDMPKPLQVTQSEGPSFRVRGRLVEWQKWTFRVLFNAREGVVLRDVAYDGRSILARGSLVEMAVPYADPHEPFHRKCAFDVGDYGLGFCGNSLELGCDCLGHIWYFDEVLNDSKGEPYTVKKAVCLHEEDAGVLYKHVEYRTGQSESRRARRLVVSFIATVVNYEYLFYWYLGQDGSISHEIKLSGELSTNALSAGETEPRHGTLVAPGVNAQIHQHMFCARLDMAVDGACNSVSEVDLVAAAPPAAGGFGNDFHVVSTPLRTEKEAQRDAAPARTWRVYNPESTNSITGKPVAYKLIPCTAGASQAGLLLTAHGAAVSERGAFARRAVWVTPYAGAERFPAGEFPVQSRGGDGLPAWTAANRSLENRRLVVWHSFGVAHVPRTEDFPVMPCESAGFSLKPDGFFLGNPGIDLPPDSPRVNGSTCCS